jgi:predicted esterase
MLSLHGAMFTGGDYMQRWRPRIGDRYAMLCPTYTSQDSVTGIWGHWWSDEAERFVLAALDRTAAEHPLDPGRIMLMGMSNGGIGAYFLAIRHPERFAAVVPMAGALPPSQWDRLSSLIPLGVYLIHGVHDQVMPVQDTDRVHRKLSELGHPNLVYVRHEWTHPQAGGHFFPVEALPELIAWLARVRRTP